MRTGVARRQRPQKRVVASKSLKVSVTNDTREEAGREDEIYRTLRNALTAAERNRGVSDRAATNTPLSLAPTKDASISSTF